VDQIVFQPNRALKPRMVVLYSPRLAVRLRVPPWRFQESLLPHFLSVSYGSNSSELADWKKIACSLNLSGLPELDQKRLIDKEPASFQFSKTHQGTNGYGLR
jgi:hypothetical protein